MLSSDEQNVSRLLSNLKRVDAPKDFDFHLKARIANASPGGYRPTRLFPVLKYTLPLALFLMVGAAFVLTNSYEGSNVPSVADAPIPSAGDTTALVSPGEVVAKVAPADSDRRVADTRSLDDRPLSDDSTQEQNPRRSERPSPPLRGSSRGSMDSGLGNAAAPIRRRGFNDANSNNSTLTPNPNEFVQAPPLQFRQMLMSLGIDASDVGEMTWKVMRLTKDGIAESSGLRVDDVMEAIDDKPIDSLYDGSFSVKSISVRREGKVVKIDIKNN